MLNFDEAKVRQDHQNGVDMIPEVEKVVDQICDEGYDNIFLFGIGGTLLYAGQIMHTAKQLGCSLPLYLENATDFLYEGNKKFTKNSVVVIASLSGNTIEVEAAIDKAHEVGARVIGYVEVPESPLAKKVDHLVTTVGGEYYWWYTVVLRFMKNAGEFDAYDKLTSQMKNLPDAVVQIYKDADEEMKNYAEKYCDEPITYLVGSGNLEDWAVCYGMCIMEEMQWMRTRPISAANFFHGTLEVIERDIPVILIKGEDKTRPEMDRVEKFVNRVSAKVTVFDTKKFALPGIDEEFRGVLSPIVMRSAFMRLNVHLEHCRRHPIDIRRYYKALKY
ncbi:MAG: SIS domain-containing protein [Holdemanella biformis]|jgi:fructoselysine-6-phosphate deglycase|uniref:SIS domain-containing protein n=1 Tax=Holdemanella TaxID=1573535 RepID=UPI001DCABB40|nr:SIS domain-containing protein [Holdemanella biformis]MBD8958035.1 SIS domain-containing protein [Holdemanella biformis]MBS6455773.1 SIS domain-containing protein [Holdemanella biformis]MEE0473790.1 SIS domain-containing protein [Holdemanella biformis]